MNEDRPEIITRIIVDDRTRQRWEKIGQDDYSLIMAEHAHLTLKELKKLNQKIVSIDKKIVSIDKKISIMQGTIYTIGVFVGIIGLMILGLILSM